jgi:hypothetical protein
MRASWLRIGHIFAVQKGLGLGWRFVVRLDPPHSDRYADLKGF